MKQLKGNQGGERWRRFSFVIVFKCPPPSGLRHRSVISTLRDVGYMSALLTKLICWVQRRRVHVASWPKPPEKSQNPGGGPPSAADAHPDGHEGAERAAALHHGLADSSHQLPAAHPDPFSTQAETAHYFTNSARDGSETLPNPVTWDRRTCQTWLRQPSPQQSPSWSPSWPGQSSWAGPDPARTDLQPPASGQGDTQGGMKNSWRSQDLRF